MNLKEQFEQYISNSENILTNENALDSIFKDYDLIEYYKTSSEIHKEIDSVILVHEKATQLEEGLQGDISTESAINLLTKFDATLGTIGLSLEIIGYNEITMETANGVSNGDGAWTKFINWIKEKIKGFINFFKKLFGIKETESKKQIEKIETIQSNLKQSKTEATVSILKANNVINKIEDPQQENSKMLDKLIEDGNKFLETMKYKYKEFVYGDLKGAGRFGLVHKQNYDNFFKLVGSNTEMIKLISDWLETIRKSINHIGIKDDFEKSYFDIKSKNRHLYKYEDMLYGFHPDNISLSKIKDSTIMARGIYGPGNRGISLIFLQEGRENVAIVNYVNKTSFAPDKKIDILNENTIKGILDSTRDMIKVQNKDNIEIGKLLTKYEDIVNKSKDNYSVKTNKDYKNGLNNVLKVINSVLKNTEYASKLNDAIIVDMAAHTKYHNIEKADIETLNLEEFKKMMNDNKPIKL